MAGNNGGPWGGGGGNRGNDDRGNNGNNGGGRGPNRPGQGPDGPQIPEIDELMKKGQEQLRVLMGGKGGGNGSNGSGGGAGGGGPLLTRGTVGIAAVIAVVAWGLSSFYTVRPEQQSVELFLGEFHDVGTEGLNFAPWPFVTAEVFNVTTNRTEDIGAGRSGSDDGLMLTTDENIVDIDFQVVWNIKNARNFLFALQQPQETVRSVSEAAMREIIAQSELAPILNRDRAAIEAEVRTRIQSTLDARETGINIIRVNFNKVDPPSQQVAITDEAGNTRQVSVIDAFRDVQAAEQERDRVERQADAYANARLADARGQSARILEEAEAYRAQQVNGAIGEASRFSSVLDEYLQAPEVTRKRLYLETMEKVLGDVDKIILEDQAGGGGQGVVPYLPLNELRRGGTN
ncbi:FtsH protease activity modulator HflK [Nereida sp. MMG025]|uniref:FtsH protease activity modulator HflK n=1 Tax=Nereida sp. MMG025 TaxID=2909981 RepID=UPI001F020D2E|nr:FtsH protease activity modulator HflK [Nereida sp. MMG025]MCF6443818.1 FtsH protease activity modulator HflK [Nereida sp. MMG025]